MVCMVSCEKKKKEKQTSEKVGERVGVARNGKVERREEELRVNRILGARVWSFVTCS